MLDFAGLSQTAQAMLDNKQEEKNSQLAELGTQIGQFREQGMTDDEIFKKISSDGSTTRRIASRLAKLYDKKDGFSRGDNPVFKLALQSVRGDARAQAVRRKSGELLAEATARVARGKPEDREKLIVQELATLRNESADLLNPDELGYFGTQTAEQALQKINADYANALSTGAAAQQLAEAQTEVRGQFLDATTPVIEAYKKPSANPYAAQAAAIEMFGIIGENAKFIGVHTEEELGQYVYSAAGEIKLAVGAKEAGEFLAYAMDNLRNGNGVAYLDGDLKAQQELDALHRAAEFEEQNRYFQAQRERETLRAAMSNSQVGLSLQESVLDDNPTQLLDKSKNAQKMILEGTPESIKAAFGIEIGPNQKGIALDWVQDTTMQLLQKQSRYQGADLEVLEGNLIDQAMDDYEGALRSLDAADVSGKQRVALLDSIKASRNNNTDKAYNQLKAGGLEEAITSAVYRTAPRDIDGRLLDPAMAQDRVAKELALVRKDIVFDSTLSQRLAESTVEVGDQLLRYQKGILQKYGEVRQDATKNNVNDKATIGETAGLPENVVVTKRQQYDELITSLATPYVPSPKVLIGGFLPELAPKEVKSLHRMAVSYTPPSRTYSAWIATDESPDRRIDAVFKKIAKLSDKVEPDLKARVASEAIAITGALRVEDLGKTLNEVKEGIALNSEEVKLPFGEEPLDLSEFNIFSVKFGDFRNASRMFQKDAFGSLQATKYLTEDIYQKAKFALEHVGQEPSQYNVLQLLSAQATHWGTVK